MLSLIILTLLRIRQVLCLIFQARTDMEQQTIEGASTSDAVGFITVVQSLKRKLKNWEKNVEVWHFSFPLSHIRVHTVNSFYSDCHIFPLTISWPRKKLLTEY